MLLGPGYSGFRLYWEDAGAGKWKMFVKATKDGNSGKDVLHEGLVGEKHGVLTSFENKVKYHLERRR